MMCRKKKEGRKSVKVFQVATKGLGSPSQRTQPAHPASAGPCSPMTDGPAKPNGWVQCGAVWGTQASEEARQIRPILNLTMTHPSSLESMCPLPFRPSKNPFATKSSLPLPCPPLPSCHRFSSNGRERTPYKTTLKRHSTGRACFHTDRTGDRQNR